MHVSKIRNYTALHKGEDFPPFRSLSLRECQELRAKLGTVMCLSNQADPMTLLQALDEAAKPILEINAENPSFRLDKLLITKGVHPEPTIYVNWYRFDDIDEMQFVDLSEHFSDIWYPGSDDLEIFDQGCQWVLAVSHNGDIRLVKPALPERAFSGLTSSSPN